MPRWLGAMVLAIGASACVQDAQPPAAAGGEDAPAMSVEGVEAPVREAPMEGVRARFAPAPQSTGAEPDTLRGTVEVVGADPATFVVLAGVVDVSPPGAGGTPEEGGTGGAPVVLLGHGEVLRQLVGLEVEVRGSEGEPAPSPAAPLPVRSFQVASAVVRSHAGYPVLDGLLRRNGAQWFIENTEGVRHTVPDLPAALNGNEGMRVWLALGPDGSPVASGVIR